MLEPNSANIPGDNIKNAEGGTDAMSGTLVKTENLEDGEKDDRIKSFIIDKFNIEDIR